MRINLTKKDLVNSVYMQLGFSKKISENLIDDFFSIILDNIKKIYEICPKIFLDLKLHDIPNTVEKGLKAISKLRPIFTTIHISGGDEMQKISALKNNKKTNILGDNKMQIIMIDFDKSFFSMSQSIYNYKLKKQVARFLSNWNNKSKFLKAIRSLEN